MTWAAYTRFLRVLELTNGVWTLQPPSRSRTFSPSRSFPRNCLRYKSRWSPSPGVFPIPGRRPPLVPPLDGWTTSSPPPHLRAPSPPSAASNGLIVRSLTSRVPPWSLRNAVLLSWPAWVPEPVRRWPSDQHSTEGVIRGAPRQQEEQPDGFHGGLLAYLFPWRPSSCLRRRHAWAELRVCPCIPWHTQDLGENTNKYTHI